MESKVLKIIRIEKQIITHCDGIEIHQKEIQSKSSKGFVYDSITAEQEFTITALISLEKSLSNADIVYKFEDIDKEKIKRENFNRRINGQKEIAVKNVNEFIKNMGLNMLSLIKVEPIAKIELENSLKQIIVAASENDHFSMECSADELLKNYSKIKNRR